MMETTLYWVLHMAIQVAVMVRILLRPHREPASRIAWVVVVAALPVIGILAYLFLGETNVGRRNFKAMKKAMGDVGAIARDGVDGGAGDFFAQVPEKYAHLFSVGYSISGFRPLAGNSAALMEDSNAAIARMVEDIDAATTQVNVLFYIWLTDNNGNRIGAALKRAAARGVSCHAMVDGLGSRALLKSPLWRELEEAGVDTATALSLGNRLLRPLAGRIDLRNHRKIVVIDGRISYCGSQNCGPRVPGQGPVCPVGRCGDPFRGPGGAPEPAPVRHRLADLPG
jgi:cardiolipin synthase